MLTKQFIISLLLFSFFILFYACDGHATSPKPAEIPSTTPQVNQIEVPSQTNEATAPEQATMPAATSSSEETVEPTLLRATTPSPIINRTTHGRIRWNEIWRGEVHITGDIIVEQGFILTIEPCTKIFIAANSDVENLNTDPFND